MALSTRVFLLALILASIASLGSAKAQDARDFFKGKTVTLWSQRRPGAATTFMAG
jgi:hypothetical protein